MSLLFYCSHDQCKPRYDSHQEPGRFCAEVDRGFQVITQQIGAQTSTMYVPPCSKKGKTFTQLIYAGKTFDTTYGSLMSDIVPCCVMS